MPSRTYKLESVTVSAAGKPPVTVETSDPITVVASYASIHGVEQKACKIEKKDRWIEYTMDDETFKKHSTSKDVTERELKRRIDKEVK